MDSLISSAFVGLVLWAGSFIYFRAYLSRRTGAERILGEFREEVGKLVADIDAATDRDVQLVEDRMKALRTLLEETDKRIATMRREADRRGVEERAYADLGKRARSLSLFPQDEPSPDRSVLPGANASSAASAASNAKIAAAYRPAAPIEKTAARVPLEAETPPVPAAVQDEAREARFIRAQMQIAPKEAPFAERVAELHRAGFSAEIIAARLGKTVGEVDLAIALSGKMDGRDGDDTGN